MEPADQFAHSLSMLTSSSLTNASGDDTSSDEVWIDVIQKMDGIYSDLVASQVQLEEKNEELEEAHQFIDSILSSMTDILIVCDLDCKIKQVNKAFVGLTGLTKEQLQTMAFGDLVHPTNKNAYDTLCSAVADSLELADFEIALRDQNDAPFALSVNCSWLRDSRNRVIGLVVIGRSVGELKAAYSKLDKAHQTLRDTQQQLIFTEKMAALGRLVAGVAHELNNPISFISGNVFVLQRYGSVLIRYLEEIEKQLPEDQRDQLKHDMKVDKVLEDLGSLIEGTVEGVERVSEIVHDLKRFSSKQSEPKSDFDLVPVVSTASNWVVRSAKTKPKIQHENCVDAVVVGLKGYIHQIIVNLIQNAVDILDQVDQPEIHISYDVTDTQVIVKIKDNGGGIDEDILPHIFEPFFTTKPIGKGTGLGLSVSFNMAEELGGKLTGANHPDGGAVFSLSLPRSTQGATS